MESRTVVLVLFLGNDLHDNYRPLASSAVPSFELVDRALDFSPPPAFSARIWLRDNILARSHLVRLLWRRAIKTNPGVMGWARRAGLVSTPNVDNNSAEQLEGMTGVAAELLDRIATLLRQRNVGFLVCVIPDPLRVQDLIDIKRYRRDDTAPVPVFRRDKELIERRVLSALSRLEIQFLHPRDLFLEHIQSGRSIYRRGYGHFTQAGHELTARLLAEKLRPLVAKRGPGTS